MKTLVETCPKLLETRDSKGRLPIFISIMNNNKTRSMTSEVSSNIPPQYVDSIESNVIISKTKFRKKNGSRCVDGFPFKT